MHEPCEDVADTNVDRTGMRLVSTTFVAATADRLRTVSVYVSGCASVAGRGVAARVRPRLAAGPTIVVSVAWLFQAARSRWSARIEAVLTIRPVLVGWTTIVT